MAVHKLERGYFGELYTATLLFSPDFINILYGFHLTLIVYTNARKNIRNNK